MSHNRRLKLLLRGVSGLAVLVFVSSCSTVSYYWQAAKGQMELHQAARPIDDWLQETAITPQLKRQLELAKSIRAFASDQLDLPRNNSYTVYADLKRPAVVWNVFAAPKDSLKPQSFCFPIAGCVQYKGFFNKQAAIDFALQLDTQGFDVQVAPVPAYSTLGWMTDPLLNTFIHYPEDALARLIFHELAHQVLYISGDTVFNESFASAIEQIGLNKWLQAYPNPNTQALSLAREQRKKQFAALLSRTKTALEQAYQHTDSTTKQLAKQAILQTFVQDYQTLKNTQWQGFGAYDAWFQPIQGSIGQVGNAHFVAHQAYSQWVPAFTYMATQHHDLKSFFIAVKELSKRPKNERDAYLNELNQTVSNVQAQAKP